MQKILEKSASPLPLKAVIFDMDGLMVDSERFVQRAWDMAGEELV